MNDSIRKQIDALVGKKLKKNGFNEFIEIKKDYEITERDQELFVQVTVLGKANPTLRLKVDSVINTYKEYKEYKEYKVKKYKCLEHLDRHWTEKNMGSK